MESHRGQERWWRRRWTCYATVGSVDFAPDADCGIEQELLPARHTGMDVCGLFRDQVVPREILHMALRNIKPRTLDEPATHDMQVHATHLLPVRTFLPAGAGPARQHWEDASCWRPCFRAQVRANTPD